MSQHLSRVPTGAQVKPLASRAGAPGPASISASQHAGNRAMVGRVGAATQQPATGTTVAAALMEANRPGLEAVRAEALVRLGKLASLESEGRAAIAAVKGRLTTVSDDYGRAYERHAAVLGRAKVAAQNQQEWTDIAVGIAIGVAVGLCIEGIAATIAVDAAAGAAAKGLKALGKQAAKEAGGESAEAATGLLAKASGLFEVAGKDLAPGGLRPDVLNTGVWRNLTSLHEQMPKVGGAAIGQALLMANAEYAIGEVKAHGSGGAKADLSEADAAQLVVDVLASGREGAELDKRIDDARAKYAAIQQAAQAPRNYDDQAMERDIWTLWMASLKHDANLLDIGAIEDYLGPEGLKLVDFGWITFDAEENKAIDAARAQADAIKVNQISAMGVAGAAAPTAGQ